MIVIKVGMHVTSNKIFGSRDQEIFSRSINLIKVGYFPYF